jgi:hypothetical protein
MRSSRFRKIAIAGLLALRTRSQASQLLRPAGQNQEQIP